MKGLLLQLGLYHRTNQINEMKDSRAGRRSEITLK